MDFQWVISFWHIYKKTNFVANKLTDCDDATKDVYFIVHIAYPYKRRTYESIAIAHFIALNLGNNDSSELCASSYSLDHKDFQIEV